MKRDFCRFLKRLFNEDSGQATVEYILILSVTVVGAIAFGRAVIRALDSGVLTIGGQLEKDLKTGRAPLNVYSN